MFAITVTITNAKERAEAEYARDHPDIIRLYREIFAGDET